MRFPSEASLIAEQVFDNPRPTVPAWLLSLGLHACLLVALCVLFVGGERAGSRDEADRSVGIVLAKRSELSPREYLAEANEATVDAHSQTVQSESLARDVALADSFVVPQLALPEAVSTSPSGLSSAPSLSLHVGGGTPRLPRADESALIAQQEASLRAANARGPTARLGLFGSKEAEGNSFVFLIDRSQSMGGSGLGVLQAAQQELVRVLQGLGPEHRFQIVVYHDKSVYLNERSLLPATDANKAAVPEFLNTKAAFGATEHERALMSALRLEPDVIFLLTDGGDPQLREPQLRNLAKYAAEGKAAIHCLHFGSGPLQQSDNFLRRLAALTGGEYGYIDVTQRRP